jgi:hypothetical protein
MEKYTDRNLQLTCTAGGIITIAKHGQTDSVSNAHADNTNPAELAMVNPAVDQPKKRKNILPYFYCLNCHRKQT